MIRSIGKSTKQLRYRAYFWLMNASSAAIFYSGAEPLAVYIFDIDEIYPSPIKEIFYSVIGLLLFVVPMFLVCARFMRDDYTEQLWKRTFVVIAYIVALLPFVYLVMYWSLFFALGQPAKPPLVLELPELNLTMGTAIYAAWMAYMMMFVVVFQFLRWKDSR